MWLIVWQLPIKAGWWDAPCARARAFNQNLESLLIYLFCLHTTIQQKYRVLFHLFFLLWTTIRPKIRSLIHLFLLFPHDHSTKIYDPLSFFFFFFAQPFGQKLGSTLIYYLFYLYTTIRPKIRIFINLFILFVHNHPTKN